MKLLKIIVVFFVIYFIRRFIQMYRVMKKIQEQQQNRRPEATDQFHSHAANSPKASKTSAINAEYKVLD